VRAKEFCMSKISRNILFIVSTSIVGVVAPQSRADDVFAFYHENVLGTSMELKLRAGSVEAAHRTEDLVLREIDRLQEILSGYDVSSEFRRWQSGPVGPRKVSPELFEILQASDHWRVVTGGAFDPRVEALTQLWASSARRGRTPTDREHETALALMSRPAWRLDLENRAVERLSECPLSFNSIGKGYIIEKACEAAFGAEQGERPRGVLLNIGGDIRVCGEIDSPIGVASPWHDSETTEPLVFVRVKDRAIASSGRSKRGFRINSQWYSHIFDPRTGLPADSIASATVIASRSADANAIATTLNVLSPEEGVRLVRSIPGVECLIATVDGRVVKSEGWNRYEQERPAPAGTFAAMKGIAPSEGKGGDNPPGKAGTLPDDKPPASGLGKDHELKIDFEIGRPEGNSGRYRRPYVAVFVEDSKERSVRTLELWLSMGGPGYERWLPDLKRWYDHEEARKKSGMIDLAPDISRPTRQPGKYSVIWNGKGDENQPLPEGEYTIIIETAREHGTYQIIRKKVQLVGKPFTEELKGNVEIKSAALEYRRRDPAKAK
jgi:thiamine biosynthesis lipoprotein ApbE